MNATDGSQWKENVLLIDADYLDGQVFQLSVQLERMLERRLPQLDLARWLDYACLDGGLRPGNNEVQAVMVYSKEKGVMNNVRPGDLSRDIDAKAFKDNLGEFLLAACPVEDEVVTRETLMVQSAEMLLTSESVKRLIIVADMALCGDALRKVLRDARQKDITLLTMQTESGFHCNQEMLSYSLLAALGVRGEELQP
jgi:hypothetical protein